MSADVKADLKRINAILWCDWDPIGCGVPEDEYESYAPEVLRLLNSGAARDVMIAHLRHVAAEALLSPISEAKAARAADELLGLDISRG